MDNTSITLPTKYDYYLTGETTTELVGNFEYKKNSSFTISFDQIKFIIDSYPDANKNELEYFLRNNLSVVNYISEAPSQIKKLFGENVKIIPEVVFDPENDSDNGTLFLYIDTNEDFDSAVQKLNVLTSDWLLPTVGSNITKFNIDLNFN